MSMIKLLYIQVFKMSEKKSQHILAVQQVLAQFQIQTQVKRITLQTLDKYMLGYWVKILQKQAFNYIQQWEKKFIEFQARLAKAQTYYRNIEININSKIQVTNSLNSRLEKFAQQFWNGMKESAQSIQQMRKSYVNLVKQTGSQSASIRSLERQLKDSNSKIGRLQSQLHQQVTKLIERIDDAKSQIVLNHSLNRSQWQNILEKVSKAKAELDSRSLVLGQLCNDIDLYKNEKKTLSSQISNIYQELNTRVLISQYNKIRVYIDNSTNATTFRVQQVYKELKQKIQEQSNQKNKEIEKVAVSHRLLENKLQLQNKSVHEQISKNKEQGQQKYEHLQSQMKNKVTELEQKSSQNKKSIEFCETQLEILQSSFEQKIQKLSTQSDVQKNTITEFQSNINSINLLLRDIQKQNSERGQQLAKLKVDTDSKGDVGEQVKKLTEKILAHDDSFREQKQRVQSLINNVDQNYEQLKNIFNQLSTRTQYKIQNLKEVEVSHFGELSTKISVNQASIEQKIESKTSNLLQNFNVIIKQKIEAIKDKFIFLEALSSDVQKFKQQFQSQLEMNQQLNKEVKQKMDRMFGMITKLKTDFYIRIQNLSLEQNKSANKIKQSSKNITEICSLLTLYNQNINILLCTNLSRQYAIQEEAQKQMLKEQVKQYKLSSILQGWVLELLADKIKYRSQLTSRKALLLACLESHVKNGDKIKGTIIQNGKDVFNRMIGSNEDYQKLRRGSLSRKKHRQSQLPKVHR